MTDSPATLHQIISEVDGRRQVLVGPWGPATSVDLIERPEQWTRWAATGESPPLALNDGRGVVLALAAQPELALACRLPATHRYGRVVLLEWGAPATSALLLAAEVLARAWGCESMGFDATVAEPALVEALLDHGYRIEAATPKGLLRFVRPLLRHSLPPLREQPGCAGIEQLAIWSPTTIDGVDRPGRPRMVRVPAQDYLALSLALAAGYQGIGLHQHAGEHWLVLGRRGYPPPAEVIWDPLDIDSEVGDLMTVLVGQTPDNAQVTKDYRINDVARHQVGRVDPIRFRAEHARFVDTLAEAGVRIVRSNAIGQGQHAAVFTRDPGFVLGNTLVVGRLARVQRAYERDALFELGLRAGRRVSLGRAVVEGGDVIMLDGRTVAVGLGQRTDRSGLAALQAAFPDYAFLPVPHAYLHLDVLMTLVDRRSLLVLESALPREFLAVLEAKGFALIPAVAEEQPTMGCNVVAVAPGRVVAAAENPRTNLRLRNAGIDVLEVPLGQVMKKGGGPRCLTCPLVREPMTAR